MSELIVNCTTISWGRGTATPQTPPKSECVCVCVCVCMCVSVCVCVCVSTGAHRSARVCVCVSVCVRNCSFFQVQDLMLKLTAPAHSKHFIILN